MPAPGLLLDTHALLWWWTGSTRLGKSARAAITNGDQSVWVSAASIWEIATKWRLGKLHDVGDPAERVPALLARHRFAELPVTVTHALRAGLLCGAHRDPFDRLIAAQALEERLTVVTRDPQFAPFGCRVIW